MVNYGKKSTQQLGKKGEQVAVDYLTRKGFHIKARNKRIGRGEVDIIARKGNLLVFVEVKMRNKHTFGHPESFVSPNQQLQYHEAATAYIDSIGWDQAIRFDIIAIEKTNCRTRLEHFEDAF